MSLMVVFVICGLAFHLVEHGAFRSFLVCLPVVRDWQLPGRVAFNSALVELFVHLRDLLRAAIAAAALSFADYSDGTKQQFLHLTADTWASRYQRRSYATLLGAWISLDWKLNIRTTATAACPGIKTAVNIRKWLGHKLRKIAGVRLEQCATVTSDAGSDMK
jgi:hypothetical protein